MMAGRAHEAENIFAGAGKFQSVERGGNGCARVTGNVFKEGRVGVEIFRHGEARAHFGRVGAEDLFIRHAARRNPGQDQFCLAFQPFDRGRDSLRAFGMAGARVADAVFIGDDGHAENLTMKRPKHARILFRHNRNPNLNLNRRAGQIKIKITIMIRIRKLSPNSVLQSHGTTLI